MPPALPAGTFCKEASLKLSCLCLPNALAARTCGAPAARRRSGQRREEHEVLRLTAGRRLHAGAPTCRRAWRRRGRTRGPAASQSSRQTRACRWVNSLTTTMHGRPKAMRLTGARGRSVSARDSGKPMVDAAFGEVMVTCEKLAWLAGEGARHLRPERRSAGAMARPRPQPRRPRPPRCAAGRGASRAAPRRAPAGLLAHRSRCGPRAAHAR